MLEPMISMALLNELRYLNQTLATRSIADTDSFEGSVEAVKEVTRDCSVCGISDPAQSAERHHQRRRDRRSTGAQPVNERPARPSCNRGFGKFRKLSSIRFGAEAGKESFDVVLSQWSVLGRMRQLGNRWRRHIPYG